jgi:thiol:disulfide interchange protein
MAIGLIQSFLQQATASGTKSTALTDLRWFAAILASALLIATQTASPPWILIFLAVMLGLVGLTYVGAYIFFAIRSPDALRSEKFTLSKMAIERSVTGDNLAGFVDPELEGRSVERPAIEPNVSDV